MNTVNTNKKHSLTNVTVRSFINSEKVREYMVFKGKGTGSQIFSSSDYQTILSFDSNFNNLKYITIFNKETGSKGGAYFYSGTDIIFDSTHPFLQSGFIFSK